MGGLRRPDRIAAGDVQLTLGDSSVRTEHGRDGDGRRGGRLATSMHRAMNAVVTLGKFVGPGFMISVAYSELALAHELGLCVWLSSKKRR